MRVCLTPAPFSDEIRTWPLDDVSILMVNMTEATGLAGRSGSGEELARMLSAEFPDAEIVITAGKDGAYFAHGDRLVFESSRPAKVVDTTAAGDTFLGFYLVAREQGADAREALGRAAAAAAISVSRPGAMSSIPRADEVL
jgi:ribokinase